MIAETREYIKGQIAAVNSDLKQLDDPYGSIEVDENQLDDGYKILFGSTSLAEGGNSADETFPVTIEIYRKTFRDVVEDFDIAFDNAVQIRDKIVNIKDVKANTNFYHVAPAQFLPESKPQNERVVKISFTVNFIRAISFC